MKLDLFNNSMHSFYHALREVDAANRKELDTLKRYDAEQNVVEWTNQKGNLCFYLDGFERPPNSYNYKFAVLNLIQAIELLCKAYLQDSGTSIFNKKGRTITMSDCVNKTLLLNPSIFSVDDKSFIQNASELRNTIQHFQLDSTESEISTITNRLIHIFDSLLSCLFDIDIVEYFEFDHWSDDFEPLVRILRDSRLSVG
ncbi:hypothetical protein V4V53_004097 [Vibrio mimicus]